MTIIFEIETWKYKHPSGAHGVPFFCFKIGWVLGKFRFHVVWPWQTDLEDGVEK